MIHARHDAAYRIARGVIEGDELLQFSVAQERAVRIELRGDFMEQRRHPVRVSRIYMLRSFEKKLAVEMGLYRPDCKRGSGNKLQVIECIDKLSKWSWWQLTLIQGKMFRKFLPIRKMAVRPENA